MVTEAVYNFFVCFNEEKGRVLYNTKVSKKMTEIVLLVNLMVCLILCPSRGWRCCQWFASFKSCLFK